MMVREVRTVVLRKGELQNLHPRNFERVAELFDVWSDRPQILRNQRQIADGLGDRTPELPPGSGPPFPTARVRGAGGNSPVGRERAEMIDPYRVEELARRAHALDPPGEAVLLDPVPAIQRITPELAGRRKGVRGHTGHEFRRPV